CREAVNHPLDQQSHGAPPNCGAVVFSRRFTVGRLVVVRAAEHRRMLIDDRRRARARCGVRHGKLGAGAGRPVLDLGRVLDDAAAEVAVDLRHGAHLPSGAGTVPYHSLRTPKKASAGGLDALFTASSQRMRPGTFRPALTNTSEIAQPIAVTTYSRPETTTVSTMNKRIQILVIEDNHLLRALLSGF